MNQFQIVGLFFFVGLFVGSLTSFYLVTRDDTTAYASRMVTSSPNTAQASLDDVMLEVKRLQRVISKLNSTMANGTKIVYVKKEPTSHEELNSIKGSNRSVKFDDFHLHADDRRMADELAKKVRVLCWIMTYEKNLETRAIHVRQTWGKRCNKLLFFSDVANTSFPTIGVGINTGRDHLTAKTMRAYDYIYRNHLHDADWFLKADDDTYIIVENLRYMLSAHSPTEAIYFGQTFKVIVSQGYNSGGAGYVLSAEALNRFGKRDATLCAKDNGAEDVEMGRCLERLHVIPGDSRDRLGRSRFHCFNPQTHLHGGYPDWYLQYDKYGAKKGAEWMSDYPVSFHYITPNGMYDLEYFAYHLGVYGIIKGFQDLNGDLEQLEFSNKSKDFTKQAR